jgi:hypothetical protein
MRQNTLARQRHNTGLPSKPGHRHMHAHRPRSWRCPFEGLGSLLRTRCDLRRRPRDTYRQRNRPSRSLCLRWLGQRRRNPRLRHRTAHCGADLRSDPRRTPGSLDRARCRRHRNTFGFPSMAHRTRRSFHGRSSGLRKPCHKRCLANRTRPDHTCLARIPHRAHNSCRRRRNFWNLPEESCTDHVT